MNPNTQPPPQPPPPSLPPPPLQPHRPSTSCDRHPQENFTGFCPSCLCERLAVLDPNSSSSSAAAAAARKPPTSSTATAALKAIFRPSARAAAAARPPPSFLPELRRTKSFSASKNEALSGAFEPQRRSCDVRARSTLFSLFNQEAEVETRTLASSSVVQRPVLESKEEEEDPNIVVHHQNDTRVPESPQSPQPQPQTQASNIENRVSEIVEEEPEIVPVPEADVAEEDPPKAMKDHMDLDSQAKKSSGRDFKGSFWSAASVFSKRLQKWRQKQKMKKRERNGVVVGSGDAVAGGEADRAAVPGDAVGDRRLRLRAALLRHGSAVLAGRGANVVRLRGAARLLGRLLDGEGVDVVRGSSEDAHDGRGRPRPRPPNRYPHPVEEPEYEDTLTLNLNLNPNPNPNPNPNLPGGSSQTREYYSDSSSRRRKSLDRSNSIRRTAAAVVAEMDELKPVVNASANVNANARVTPAASVEYIIIH
ncbi:UPF0503 protein [Spatholobus suberectus]|nr:UPF0503 protein [Spatholobus suberectus]